MAFGLGAVLPPNQRVTNEAKVYMRGCELQRVNIAKDEWHELAQSRLAIECPALVGGKVAGVCGLTGDAEGLFVCRGLIGGVCIY